MTPLEPVVTADLVERDLKVLWHPCAQMRDYRLPPPEGFPPLHVVAAQGTRIRLADGTELLDAISSWWCKSLGHGHPKLRAALLDQAQRFEHVILANTTHEPIVRLSERLLVLANHPTSEGCPASAIADRRWPIANPLAKVFYACDGSTGVEIAIKMALQAQAQRGPAGRGRTRFAHFENGYHGETVATLAVGDCGLYADPYKPLMFDSLRVAGLPYRSGPDDPRWLDASDEWPAIERQLDSEADRLAAVIYEPVLQAAGGMRLYSPDLLPRLRRWADDRGVYLIADEIAAGMGRCGAMLATHLAPPAASGLQGLSPVALPDFAVMSKGLTGGFMPLSAVLTTDAIYELFDADYLEFKAFLHSNTYSGHALAVAVANAALDIYAEEDVLGLVARHGPMLRRGLADLARTRPYLRHVRGVGMMAAVDICRPDGTPPARSLRTGYAVYRQAVRRGALLRNLGDTMYLFPALNTPPADIEAMLDILGRSLDAVLGV